MRILAIETSCDETAIAVLDAKGTKASPQFRVLANVVLSQVKLHAKFGGVVPNLAKREHQKNLVPVLVQALKEARLYARSKKQAASSKEKKIPTYYQLLTTIFSHEPELFKNFLQAVPKLAMPDIDAIAVTYGPGLAPALWTGVNFAKALALLWEKPLLPVNHLEGHIYVNVLRGQNLRFPALALIVSGGHTELVLMKKHGDYHIVGETLDDAAGEAFDKVARLLGLGYPGGPQIACLAQFAQTLADSTQTVAEKFPRNSALRRQESARQLRKLKLPRPMLGSGDYNFSFSGLKTAVLYHLRDRKGNPSQKIKSGIAHEFQNAVVEVLAAKTIRAAKEFKAKTLILGGGVAANTLLRTRLSEEAQAALPKTKLLLPEVKETTDNALMIAAAAFFTGKEWSARSELRADPGLRLSKR